MAALTRRARAWHTIVLAVAGVYFTAPLVASFVFTVDVPGQGLTGRAYTQILGAPGFLDGLGLSLLLAAATIVLVLALVVPAMVAVRLRPGRLGSVIEVLCTLPLVVPPLVMSA